MSRYVGKHTKKPARKNGKWVAIVLLIVLAAAAALVLKPYIEDALKLELHAELTVEAGSAVPSAQEFLAEEEDVVITYASDVSKINTCVPGTYPVTLQCKKDTYQAAIRVVDTAAPTAQVQNLTVLQANMPVAEDFVTGVQDATEVTVAFEKAPDETLAGEQDVTIVLTDAGGNITKLNVVLTVIIDTEAPVITGTQDITLYQGGTVAYRSGVTVTDDQDEAPALQINSSAVDLSTPGQYQVVYTATDATGNTATVTTTVTVLEKKESYVEMEVIYEKAQELLDSIVDADMTDREKVTAIYTWIRSHCGYGDGSDKSDWLQAAYKMMTKRGGDCFNYFALCKLLMEMEGIPNIDVEKVRNHENDSRHYWSLVSVDGGLTYYHVDTTPRYNDHTQFLLVTDAFLDDYSAKHGNCFNRDKTLYPATPES